MKRKKADWQKSFKKEWKELSTQTINNSYLTDINNWICGCPYFLKSRFLICKHLVQQKGIVDIQFFNQIYQHNQYPFLNSTLMNITDFKQSTTFQMPCVEIIQDEDEEIYEEIYTRLIDATERSLELLKDQYSKKNFKWIKGVEKNFKPIEGMLNEISVYKRRKTMPCTFKDHSHNTLFFN